MIQFEESYQKSEKIKFENIFIKFIFSKNKNGKKTFYADFLPEIQNSVPYVFVQYVFVVC